MKIIRLGLTTLLLAGISQAGSSLILGPQDGLAEKCEVESYNGPKETVKVVYNTGSTNLSLRSFNTAAQKKILSWVADERFESSGLMVQIGKNETEEDVSTEEKFGASKKTTKGSIKTVSYKMTFENNTDIALENVQVEYRTFFVQKKGQKPSRTYGGELEKKLCRIENVTVPIKSGGTITSTTSGVSIRDLKEDSYGPGYSGVDYTKDELEGFCVSVSRKDSNGKTHRKTYEEGRVPKEKDWEKYTRQ